MKVVEYADVASFRQAAESMLAEDVANNTHSLSALQRLRRTGAHFDERMFAVHDARLVATLIRVDSGHAFISNASAAACALLAVHLREHDVALEGVAATADAVAAFTEHLGRATTPYVQLMLYRHEGNIVGGDASGEARIATESDLDSVVAMLDAFDAELGMFKLPTPTQERAARRIAAEEITLWTLADEVVALAGANPLPANSARVGPVYTCPTHRALGYAQAVTAAATRNVQRDKPRTVFLFTDASYPASNKAYQRIGYRHIADHAHVLFHP